MRYVRDRDIYVIRFEDGETVPDRFLEFLERQATVVEPVDA